MPELAEVETQILTVLTLASGFGAKNVVELLINKFNVDETINGFGGRNCFIAATIGNKHDNMSLLHSVNSSLCKGKDEDGVTALLS